MMTSQKLGCRPRRPPTARTGSRSAAPCPTAPPGCGRSAPRRAAREHLDLVGDAGTRAVDQPEDRKLLAQCGFRGPHDLLDGARPPRPGLHRGVVGDDDHRSAVDGPPPGDHAVGRQPRRPGVRVAAVLDEAAVVDQQRDPVAHVELVLPRQLGRRLLGRTLGCRERGRQPTAHVRDPRVPDHGHRHLGGQRVSRRPGGRCDARRRVADRRAARRGGGLFEVRAHRHTFLVLSCSALGCSGGCPGNRFPPARVRPDSRMSGGGEAEALGDDEALDLAGALADLEDLGVAVEAGDRVSSMNP